MDGIASRPSRRPAVVLSGNRGLFDNGADDGGSARTGDALHCLESSRMAELDEMQGVPWVAAKDRAEVSELRPQATIVGIGDDDRRQDEMPR